MLDRIGDSLNWAAAGVFFPLLFLPLTKLVADKGRGSAGLLFLASLVAVLCGAAFVYAVPALRSRAGDGWELINYRALLIYIASAGAIAFAVFVCGGATRASALVASVFAWVTRITGRTVMWLLLVMALLQFTVVLMRYVFGINYIFMQESITYMHGAVFLLSAGYALLANDHVRVDIFYRDAAPKRKALVDLAGAYLFLFPICLLILWTASPYVARSWIVMEGSTDTSGIQGVYLLKALIPAFAVLLAMAGFVIADKAVDALRKTVR